MLVTIAFLALGLALVAIFKFGLHWKSETALLIVFAFPVVLYLLGGGGVSELEGFGMKAKLVEIADKQIREALDARSLAVTDDEATRSDFLQAYTGGCKPYFLVHVGVLKRLSKDQFSEFLVAAARSLRSSLVCGSLRALIVVD